MTLPLVSVIIPLYNAENYIAETLESVLRQTWPNKEIIVINDGSTDKSLQIASQYASDVVNIIDQPNQGACAARNKGLSIANGSFIQFLDCDDLLSPDKIEHQVKLLQNAPERVAVSSTIHFTDKVSDDLVPSAHEEKFLSNDDDPAHFLIKLWGGYDYHGSMIAIHSWLVPRHIIELAGQWNTDLSVDDDGEYFCRVLLRSKGILKSEGISYYRKHQTNTNLSSRKTEEAVLSRLKAAQLKKKHVLTVTRSFEAQRAIFKSLMVIAIDCYHKYPNLYREAITSLPPIKFNYLPNFGSKLSNIVAYMFGWRLLIRVKNILRR